MLKYEQRYVSMGTAARMLGVTSNTIRRYVDKGLLRAIRSLGGHRRIYEQHLLELVETRKIKVENSDYDKQERRVEAAREDAEFEFLKKYEDKVPCCVLDTINAARYQKLKAAREARANADPLGLADL